MVLKIITVLTLSTFLLVINPIFADTDVKINEFLAHPSSGNKEWVEFYNPGNVDLSEYFLDDDSDFLSDTGSSAKKNLQALNKTNPTYSFLEFDSFLNNSGDKVVLFATDGTIIDQYQFNSDPGSDIPLGRSPDGGDNFAVLAQSTKGSINSQEIVEPTENPTPKTTQSGSQPTITVNNTTTAKAQTPTPNITKTAQKSETKSQPSSPLPSSIQQRVLGIQNLPESTPSIIPTMEPTPDSEHIPETQEKTNNLFAYMTAGLGTILIVSSAVFYFIIRRKGKFTSDNG